MNSKFKCLDECQNRHVRCALRAQTKNAFFCSVFDVENDVERERFYIQTAPLTSATCLVCRVCPCRFLSRKGELFASVCLCSSLFYHHIGDNLLVHRMKFSPTSFQKWAILLVFIAGAIAVLFAGFHVRNGVLKSNPCQMTYSKRDKTEVPLCGKNCEYKLWKVSNPLNKKLNPQPVLYIPGHLGRYNCDQLFTFNDSTAYPIIHSLDSII